MTTTANAKTLGTDLGLRARAILTLALFVGAALMASLAPAKAQSQFSPAIIVDSEVITVYQLSQRQAFLTLLRAPGDVRQLAADQLINEAIQLRAAREADMVADDAAVLAGMEEFAARGNLTAEKLLALFAQNGIAAETFRDFVAAGVTWRDYSRKAFGAKAGVTTADIDAAMAKHVPEPSVRLLLSEIVLPGANAPTRKASRARADRLAGLDETEFGQAALRFSIGASRNNLGKMNWVEMASLPTDIAAAVRGLEPGEMSRPVERDEDIRLYFVRDREEVTSGTPPVQVDYAALLLPGGQSDANKAEAARIRERVTGCDDLYPIGRALPPEQLVRETLPVSAVPAAYAAELERLDAGEISSRLVTSSGAMVVLMLCSRGNETPRSLTREMVESQLKNQRIATLAQVFLEEQRANAHIETPGL